MKYVALECNKCGLIEVFPEYKRYEGLNCEKCKGALIPKGEAKVFERKESSLNLKVNIDDMQLEKLKNDIEFTNNFFKSIYKYEYEVLTKDDYIREFLCSRKRWYRGKEDSINLEELWKKVSKGYNFVIRAGETIYSVDYLNNIIGSK